MCSHTHTHTHTHTHIYIYVYIYICIYIKIIHLSRTRHKVKFFMRTWIQSLLSLRSVEISRLKRILFYYLPIYGEIIDGFMPFSRKLEQCEMKSAPSKSWTQDTVSIFYFDNHYIKSTSTHAYIYIYIYIYIYMYILIMCVHKREREREREREYVCGGDYFIMSSCSYQIVIW